MDRFEGLDPVEVAAIEARLEAAVAQEDNEALAAIVAQVCQTLIGLADAMKALGEVVWPATEAITDLARRMSDLEDAEAPVSPSESALEQTLAEMERARLGRLQWHALAIDRGQFEVHLESDQPPMLVTEFGRTPASPEELRRLGYQVEEST
jgi:hypothetical protein